MAAAAMMDALGAPPGIRKPGRALSGPHVPDLLSRVLRALVDRDGLDTVLANVVSSPAQRQLPGAEGPS